MNIRLFSGFSLSRKYQQLVWFIIPAKEVIHLAVFVCLFCKITRNVMHGFSNFLRIVNNGTMNWRFDVASDLDNCFNPVVKRFFIIALKINVLGLGLGGEIHSLGAPVIIDNIQKMHN